jgi:hypothetical protein
MYFFHDNFVYGVNVHMHRCMGNTSEDGFAALERWCLDNVLVCCGVNVHGCMKHMNVCMHA